MLEGNAKLQDQKNLMKLWNKQALKMVARLAHVDLTSAMHVRRISPIMEREIGVDEELVNFRESVETYYAAGDTIHKYPKMYEHASKEKRLIMQHCFGLVTRMMMNMRLPLAYNREDIDEAVRHLVQIVVDEARYTGKRLDAEMIAIFRPYLSMKQRIALRDFRVDSVMSSSYMERAQSMIGRLPLFRPKQPQ